MADTAKVYEDPQGSPTTGAATGRTKVYEQKNKRAWWLIPLLIIIAALLIWAVTRNHRHGASTQTVAVATLPDLHFGTNQAALTTESQTTLGSAVDRMKTNPDLKMRIEGYADSTGNAAHNKTLSDQRTDAVTQFMTSRGIDSSRLTGQGFGQADPVSTNATATGKADNRRVRVQLFD